MMVGVPYAPISVPYSLMSGDFGKLKSIIESLTPKTGDVVIPLSRNNPIVALVVASLRARHALRQSLRPVVHFLRSIKDKEP